MLPVPHHTSWQTVRSDLAGSGYCGLPTKVGVAE